MIDARARAHALTSSYGEWGEFRIITVPLELSSFAIPFHLVPRPGHCDREEKRCRVDLKHGAVFLIIHGVPDAPPGTANISENTGLCRFPQIPMNKGVCAFNSRTGCAGWFVPASLLPNNSVSN